jgi:hypothetical protein
MRIIQKWERLPYFQSADCSRLLAVKVLVIEDEHTLELEQFLELTNSCSEFIVQSSLDRIRN